MRMEATQVSQRSNSAVIRRFPGQRADIGRDRDPQLEPVSRIFRQARNGEKATAALLALVDKGSRGVAAAMAGTPYA